MHIYLYYMYQGRRADLVCMSAIKVENMLAMGPFPRFAGATVKNIEDSWAMVVEAFTMRDAGGTSKAVGMGWRFSRVQLLW